MLVVNPKKRMTVAQIKKHKWMLPLTSVSRYAAVIHKLEVIACDVSEPEQRSTECASTATGRRSSSYVVIEVDVASCVKPPSGDRC